MRKTLSLIIACLIIFGQPIPGYSSSDFSSNKNSPVKTSQQQPKPEKISDESGMQAEIGFYLGNFTETEKILTVLKNKRDRNFSLWCNQLGSLYLAMGDQEKAKEEFLDAFKLMNDIAAFKNLERQGLGLTGSEASKGYKGDPYEKVYNSLYLGLLLYGDNDTDNALACFQNGILCDSDVTGNLYKSDVAPLYVLAARAENVRGNKSMADDYLKKAQEAYFLSSYCNRVIVSEEQALLSDLDEKQKELDKIEDVYEKKQRKIEESRKEAEVNKNKSKQNFSGRSTEGTEVKISPRDQKAMDKLKRDIEKTKEKIDTLDTKMRENNNRIDLSILQDISTPSYNTLLCVEMGRGPLKYQIGQYGEMAIFKAKPGRTRSVNVTVDARNKVDDSDFLKNNDTLYQASTRGGRMMDGILKGKATFKKTTAQTSSVFAQMSAQMASQAAISGVGGGDSTGALAAAAVFALASLAMAAASSAANPAADARHWSYMPAELQIIPLKLSPGMHHFKIEALDEKGKAIDGFGMEFDANIKPGDNNIIFKRIMEKSL